MKQETRSFYERLIVRAVSQVAGDLDSLPDFRQLARDASLSPLHFHRIFSGLVGETPLGMHRRLRLERAAHQLALTSEPVTQIAFEAGYHAHEAFTRAFREAYASSPRAFRELARREQAARRRAPTLALAAPCGVHYLPQGNGEGAARTAPSTQPPTTTLYLNLSKDSPNMNVTLQDMPELRVATVAHRGPYSSIFQAFERLHCLVGGSPLADYPDLKLVALYHDDPEATPPAELRSEAGVVVPKDVELPAGLGEHLIPSGTFARTTHMGPYTLLGDAWSRLMGGWLPQSGRRVGAGPMYEHYLNTPMTAAPDQLRTDLYLSLAE